MYENWYRGLCFPVKSTRFKIWNTFNVTNDRSISTTFERVNSSHDTCCSFVGNSWLVSHTLTDLGPTHWNFLVFMNIYSSQYIDEKVKSKIMLWNHAVYNRWIRKHLRDLWNFLYEIWRSQTEYELFMKTREKSSLHTVSTCETDHGFPTMTSSLLYACY